MASLATNPWLFTSGDAGSTVWFKTDIHACHFEWAGYAAQGNKVVVKDRLGKAVWRATGKADLSLVESFTLDWLHGLVVDTLDSGELRVFFE